MALRHTSGSVEAPPYDGEYQHDLLTIRIHHGLLKFSKIGKEVEIYVQHGDLDDMLRAEVAVGETRQDNIGDDEGDDLGDSSYSDSEGSDAGFVDEEYDMADDDTLFARNVDEDVDESGPFSHTELCSNAIHEQLRDSDGHADLKTMTVIVYGVTRNQVM
ncbi:hypothetical protein LIER_12831 [Lithospermum erythrorhizon]|uniref:Uncharacterized protein n=1 Tax=Lithospermum erythrorhizon TaxID=34254 RepID=A0AAV3PWD1_LITER